MGIAAGDRRRRERVALRCPVELVTPAGGSHGGTTRDLSSDGVYWISGAPFHPGEQVQCSILIKVPGYRAAHSCLTMLCSVRVLRIEGAGQGFGVGAAIESYTLASRDAAATGMGAAPAQSLAYPPEPKVPDDAPRCAKNSESFPLFGTGGASERNTAPLEGSARPQRPTPDR